MGVKNRSVTIQGKPKTTGNWIHSESLHPAMKKAAYKAMGMQHFSWIHRDKNAAQWNISCHEHLYNQYAVSAGKVTESMDNTISMIFWQLLSNTSVSSYQNLWN